MDVFEFDDDDDDLQSPPSSPVIIQKRITKLAVVSKPAEETAATNESVSIIRWSNQTSSSTIGSPTSTSTSTSSSLPVATGTPNSPSIAGGRTRHARERLKKQQLLQQEPQQPKPQQQQPKTAPQPPKVIVGREENNGCSPSKHVRFSIDNNTQQPSNPSHKRKKNNGDDDDFDDARPSKSVLSSCSTSDNGTGIVRRKRRRKQQLPDQEEEEEATAALSSNHNPDILFTKEPRGLLTRPLNRNANKNENNLHHDDDEYSSSLTPPKPLPQSSRKKNSSNRTKQRSLSSRTSNSSSTTTKSISEQIQQKLQQHERQQQQLCPRPSSNSNNHHQALVPIVVSRKVRGAGRDACAIQDAGNFQMISDECGYLTSAILGTPKSHIPTKAGIVESVSELAVLLSNTKTRRALWATTTTQAATKSSGNSASNDSDSENANALDGVLDVLGYTTSALTEKFHSDQQRLVALTEKFELASTRSTSSSRVSKSDCDHDDDEETVTTNNRSAVAVQRLNTVENYYKGLLLDSLAAIVSFLSWDCTVDNRASSYHKNPTGARALRKIILQHDGALAAFLYIIRNADPVVSSILEAKLPSLSCSQNTSCVSASANHINIDKQSTDDNAQNHNGVSNSQNSDLSSKASPSKTSDGCSSVASSRETDSVASNFSSEDPTAAGRRKRRQKKATSALEPIAEDGSFTNGTKTNDLAMSPPRSPPPRAVVFQKQHEASCDARTKLSFTSEDAMTMSPPRSPIRRRWGGGSPGRQSDRDDGSSSMASCDSTLIKIHYQLGKSREKFIKAPSEKQFHALHQNHDCQGHRELPLAFGGKDPAGSAASMALNALHRLLSGKEEGDAHSCLDEADEDATKKFMSPTEDSDDEYNDGLNKNQSKNTLSREEDELLRSNPLLQTNRMLGDSGVIPRLAQSMSETLGAATFELEEGHNGSCTPCRACLVHLLDKFQGLAPIVDNACLLHDDNRVDFCLATASNTEDNDSLGMLVGSLIVFLRRWLQHKSQRRNGNHNGNCVDTALNEMGLSALRTLTSLTHDNSLAAEQLAVKYLEIGKRKKSSSTSWSGVQVIGQVLYRAATARVESAGKVAYDTCIFCLNTLANVVGDEPHGDVRRILVGMKWPQTGSKGKSIYFLRWLTQWLIGQTESFRDAIMKGSFGGDSPETNGQHSNRELETHEHEQLVTAGNGCVLLACLLMDPPHINNKNNKGTSSLGVSSPVPAKQSDHCSMDDDADQMAALTQRIREIILSEMPLDERTGLPSGTTFIQNTLRAFSNFLYYSVGDLSVAVVAPVRKLISELEKIQVEVIA